jgi:hypothetical protein
VTNLYACRFSSIEPEPAYVPLPGVKEEEWEAPLFAAISTEASGNLITCCDVAVTPASPGARISSSDGGSTTTRSSRYSVATCLGGLAIACGVLVVVMCCVGDVPMPGGASPEVTSKGDTDWPKAMIDGFDDMQIAVELSQQKAAAAQASSAAAGSQVSYLGVHLPKATHADVGMSPILQQLANSWAHINKEVTKQGSEQLSSNSFEATHMDQTTPQEAPEHTTEDQAAQAVLESDFSAIAHAVQGNAVGGDSQGIATAASGPLDMPGGAQATLKLDGSVGGAATATAAAVTTTEAAPAPAATTAAVGVTTGDAAEAAAQQHSQDQQQPAGASSTDALLTIQQDATILATAPAEQPQQAQQQHQEEEVKQAGAQLEGGREGVLTDAALTTAPAAAR